jgi:hypothetical protein
MDDHISVGACHLARQKEVCYTSGMNTTFDNKPKTVFMPVTTMEEVPVLRAADRAELIASIRQAEADIGYGAFALHNPQNFVQDMAKYRTAALIKKGYDL